ACTSQRKLQDMQIRAPPRKSRGAIAPERQTPRYFIILQTAERRTLVATPLPAARSGGNFARPMALSLDKDVLLFFEDVDRDTFVRGHRRLHRFLRKTWYLARSGRPSAPGFDMRFALSNQAQQ